MRSTTLPTLFSGIAAAGLAVGLVLIGVALATSIRAGEIATLVSHPLFASGQSSILAAGMLSLFTNALHARR